MDEAKCTMSTAGWLDTCQGGLPPQDALDWDLPRVMAASLWQSALSSKTKEIIAARNKSAPTTGEQNVRYNGTHDTEGFRLVGQSYLDADFVPERQCDHNLIADLIFMGELNAKHEPAFRIIADHASCTNPECLQMHLGGIGGTGKLRVIQSLATFFEARGKAHCLVVVASIGSVAALLSGGLTYHSVLNINDRKVYDLLKSDADVQAKLAIIEYIFMNETSMILCRDMCKISVATVKAMGKGTEAFGGLNIIFTGDFAQLKPVGGKALYSGHVGMHADVLMSQEGQEAVIGRVLWHETTTVVILREHMRQKHRHRLMLSCVQL